MFTYVKEDNAVKIGNYYTTPLSSTLLFNKNLIDLYYYLS